MHWCNRMLIGLVLIGFGSSSLIGAVNSVKFKSLAELERYALAHNPRLQALEYTVEASKHWERQEGVFEDMSLGVENAASTIVLGQTIRVLGDSSDAAAAARYGHELTVVRLHQAQSSVIRQLRQIYYHIYALDQELALTDWHLSVWKRVMARLRAQKESTYLLSRARLGYQARRVQKKRLIQERRVSLTRLELALGLVDRDVQLKPLKSLGAKSGLPKVSSSALHNTALHTSEYQEALLDHKRAQARLKARQRESWAPDLNLNFNYNLTDGSGGPAGTLYVDAGISVPWFNPRRRAAVGELEQLVRATELQLEFVRIKSFTDLAVAYDDLSQAGEMISYYQKRVVPEVQTLFNAVIPKPIKSPMALWVFLDAEQNHYASKKMLIDQRVDYYRAKAQIDWLKGSTSIR